MQDKKKSSSLASLLAESQAELLNRWVEEQLSSSSMRKDLIAEADLRSDSGRLLQQLVSAVQTGESSNIHAPEWQPVRDLLNDISESRVSKGFRSSETATFVFSLKRPIFTLLQARAGANPAQLAQDIWMTSELLDKLGLYTVETFQKTRETLIQRQQQEMMELSTPVVKLYDGILALPLIGTLDSARTQVVMENLLNQIVSSGASIAILDITGVPTVDTLVAQHLLKTVAAARLMGADCIISGIRPQIAQTIVQLGVELNVISKATLADALALALKRTGRTVEKVNKRKRMRPEETAAEDGD